MVRLVFRPYTQLRRSICTSEPLRTSTEFSPASSWPGIDNHLSGPDACALGAPRPSIGFGTPRGCAGRLVTKRPGPGRGERAPHCATAQWLRRPSGSPLGSARRSLRFRYASGFSGNRTRGLAHVLDSLARVSRRGGWTAERARRRKFPGCSAQAPDRLLRRADGASTGGAPPDGDLTAAGGTATA